MTVGKKKGKKGLWLQGVFVLAVLAFFLVGVEVLLRSTHLFGATVSWSEPDPRLGYRYTPGKRYWYHKENDHPIAGMINSHGWRDREWQLAKPPGVARVAVIGDSYVEAFQVESERTFLALAESRLNVDPCGRRVEVMNFGRSGYTQTEEWIVLREEVSRFSPDLAVLFFYPGNDIEDMSRETSPESDRPFFRALDDGKLVLDTSFTRAPRYRLRCLLNLVKQHSALVSLVGERYNLYKTQKTYEARRKQEGYLRDDTNPAGAVSGGTGDRLPGAAPDLPPLATPQPLPGYLSLCTSSPDPAQARSYQLCKTLIREMAAYCKERGIGFVIMVMFDPDHEPEVEAELKAKNPTHNPRFFEDDLEQYARTLGVHYLEVHEPARRHVAQGGEPLLKVHLNYRGHELVGEVLASGLRDLLCPRSGEVGQPGSTMEPGSRGGAGGKAGNLPAAGITRAPGD